MSPVLALAGLFFWSFLAATIVPIGSEPALVAIVRSSGEIALPVAIATAGNVLGAATTWWIGKRLGTALEAKRPPSSWDARARRMFERWGQPSLLLAWLPLVGDAIVLVAGAAGVKAGPFLVWVTIGKAARYIAVALGANAM